MQEIGSDFWKAELKYSDKRFLLSGRTALEYIIRDILVNKKMHSVLMPAYCCHTMLEPFLRHGIEIRFYDVFYDGNGLCIKMPQIKKQEIVFVMRYFGYCHIRGLNLEELKKSENIIIEDRTHSWLSQTEDFSDYSFISYRKWTGIGSIALAEKKTGRFCIPLPQKRNKEFEKTKRKAENLKQEYIENNKGDKKPFLELFEKSEELLEDYVDCVPSYESIYKLYNLDLEKIVISRRKNALWLLNYIKNIPGVVPVFDKIEDLDVPLFVPVLLDPEKRDRVKNQLINHSIYSPVHWPLSNFHKVEGRVKELYQKELSILCDQRYTIREMQKIVDVLKTI